MAPLATSRSPASGWCFLHFLTCKFLMELEEAVTACFEAASSYLNGWFWTFPHLRYERLREPLGSTSLFSFPSPPESLRCLQRENSIASSLLITWWLHAVNTFLCWAGLTSDPEFFSSSALLSNIFLTLLLTEAYSSNYDSTKGCSQSEYFSSDSGNLRGNDEGIQRSMS